MIYLKEFETVSAYETFATSEEFIEPNVSMIGEYGQPGFGVKYNKDKPGPTPPVHDYSQDYLTFVFSTSGSISVYHDSLYLSNDDGENWVQETVSVNSGDRILVKGDVKKSYEEICSSIFSCEGNFSVEGNIMSVYDSINFRNRTSFDSNNHDLSYLFSSCVGLVSAENLVLPVTALTYCCYESMFDNCTSLTTAPALSATTLASNCYYNMFNYCSSLTTAPALPATTLATSCYLYMFANCTSLTTAPALPATTLATGCYDGMFAGCTNLTTAPSLPATNLAEECCANMFDNCTSLTTAPSILPATTLTDRCYQQMFNGCTSLTSAPELPATTLAASCYNGMFSYCSSLNYIKCLATDISASNCTNGWVDGVSSTGTFVKDASMSSWTTGIDGIPTNWTVQDAS